ncbi:helix-turn-helix domain-containing protein [Brucella anthropi]|uniref:helix-turn-helix domain-containing protein n=1 Tax=Brucella anthropi TaxID=529 RepID=UPI00235F3075|nr:helix-turn-helix domain-containing protein [Brucella anthropi]
MTRSSMPEVLVEIAQVAGTEVAWEIVRAQGGVTVYIPSHPKPDHWLVELVGMEAAQKICAHFCVGKTGIRLTIPMGKYTNSRERLVKALEAGMTAPQAALAAGMHERSAYRARKRIRKSKQGNLF